MKYFTPLAWQSVAVVLENHPGWERPPGSPIPTHEHKVSAVSQWSAKQLNKEGFSIFPMEC